MHLTSFSSDKARRNQSKGSHGPKEGKLWCVRCGLRYKNDGPVCRQCRRILGEDFAAFCRQYYESRGTRISGRAAWKLADEEAALTVAVAKREYVAPKRKYRVIDGQTFEVMWDGT